MGRWIKRILLFVLALAVATVTYLAFSIYQFSERSQHVKADVAIVLGASVIRNKPSPVYLARIKQAVDLVKTQQVKALIFTGGVGAGEAVAESEVGRLTAMSMGVPYTNIQFESQSHTTLENLLQAYQLMKQHHYRSALIVSDPLHMKRAMAIAHTIGIPAFSSPSKYTQFKSTKVKARMLAREVYYYLGYLYNAYFRPVKFHISKVDVKADH